MDSKESKEKHELISTRKTVLYFIILIPPLRINFDKKRKKLKTMGCWGEQKTLKNKSEQKSIESFCVLNSFTLWTKAFISFDTTQKSRGSEGFLMPSETCFHTFLHWIKYIYVRQKILIRLHFDRLALRIRMNALFITKQDPIMSNVLYCSLSEAVNHYKAKKKLNWKMT